MADIMFPGEEPVTNLGVTRLPENIDLTIWKGDAQEYFIILQSESLAPIDLTGATAQAVIRANFTATESYPFACTVVAPTQGKVRMYLSSANSKLIPAGDYVWNFQITSTNGDVRTYLAGDVKVLAEVD